MCIFSPVYSSDSVRYQTKLLGVERFICRLCDCQFYMLPFELASKTFLHTVLFGSLAIRLE